MTPDGFITLLALVLTVLGVLPKVRQLHLHVTLLRNLCVSLPALAFVLYFEFYAVAQVRCPVFLADELCDRLTMSADSPFGPRDAALAVAVVWTITMGVMYQIGSIAAGTLPRLRRSVDRLVRERDYATLIDLVDPQLDLIDRAARRQLLRQRHHDWWARLRAPDRRLIFKGLPFPVEPAPAPRFWRPPLLWARRQAGWLGWPLPHARSLEEAARAISKRLLTDPGLRHHLVQHRPDFGTRLMVLPGHVAGDFMRLFVTDLAADSASSLYLEIEQSGGADHFHGRTFDADSPLLAALLNDANVVSNIEAYTPIAEHFLSRLNPDNDAAYISSLAKTPDRLWDEIAATATPAM